MRECGIKQSSSLVGEVGIQSGNAISYSRTFWLPAGKSFLFFHNVGSNPFIIRVPGLPVVNDYVKLPDSSGVITLELGEPLAVFIEIECPSSDCQGLAMMASCLS